MRLFLALLPLLFFFTDCTAHPAEPDKKRPAAVVDTIPLVPYQDIDPDKCPKDYFRHPLNCPVSLTGTFAEIRPNHYHSGIDLRIGGKVGEPVYAAQEGYVSRIAISPWGGGKVLYIDHPNGYRTVYMHLNDFVGDIGKYVRDYQYQHEVFSFDIAVPKGSLPVSKGQLVAHAGNTGSSGGPHLHYEVRLASTDQTINPLYFGTNYSDPVKPVIRGVRLYPTTSDPIPLTTDTVLLGSPFYAGIYATDLSETGNGKNGVEKIELFVDDTLFFIYSTASFLFEETRSVNAIIDYSHYQSTREYYIVSRHFPTLRMPNHRVRRNQGILDFADHKCHKLSFVVSDYKGNTSRRTFHVVDTAMVRPSAPSLPSPKHPISCSKSTRITLSGFTLTVPPRALYANDGLVVSTRSDSRYLSPVYSLSLQRNPLPLHVACTLAVKCPKGADASRLVVVSVKDGKLTACPTEVVNDSLVATIKELGDFAVMADTKAPSVKAVNFKESSPIGKGLLRIRLTDDLSGVNAYRCLLDDRWILAEYDGKTTSLYIDPSRIAKGTHSLLLLTTDGVGNVTTKTWKIVK